jgi:hypothetical protein
MEVILFPDAAAIIVDWLRPELADRGSDVPVMSRVPSPAPRKFVTVRRGGGTLDTLVTDAATLFVECWAGTEEAAMDLAQLSRALIHSMQGTLQNETQVYRVQEFSGPALLPDPVSDQPRVVFTVQVQLRGHAA